MVANWLQTGQLENEEIKQDSKTTFLAQMITCMEQIHLHESDCAPTLICYSLCINRFRLGFFMQSHIVLMSELALHLIFALYLE